MSTLSDMEAELYDHFGHSGNTPVDVINRFRRNLNIAYKEILSMKGMSKLRRAVLTFSSVASTPFAVLPQAASRIITIQDRTNQITLGDIGLQDIRRNDPGLAATVANPYGYVILNLAAPVAMDPSDASELFIKSTSASDGTGVTASLSGVITGGYQRTATKLMNGVTAASMDSSITSWLNITGFNISALAKGVVTLHEDSGTGAELARIAIGRSSARYTRIILYPTPSAAVTYHADVELLISALLCSNDEPVIPDDFQWLLPCGAMMREYAKREKHTNYAEEKARWRSGIGDLRMHLQRKSGVGDGAPRHSSLGSYYPAGT